MYGLYKADRQQDVERKLRVAFQIAFSSLNAAVSLLFFVQM